MCESRLSYPSNGTQCFADFSLSLLVPPALAFHLLFVFVKRKLHCALYEMTTKLDCK